MESIHNSNGPKGYIYLAKNIISMGYYFNNLYRLCKNVLYNCCEYIQKKNHFKKPAVIQIIWKGPHDTYQMDISVLPNNLKMDEKALYLLSII